MGRELFVIDYIAIPIAGWAIAYLLTKHTGPFNILLILRFKSGASSVRCMEQRKRGVSNVLCCWECLAVWTVPILYGVWLYEPVIVEVIAWVGIAWVVGRVAKWAT